MKLIHLADLHLGKRVNEFPMLEDQRYILGEILRIIGEEAPDAVLIAGDVYDKPVPAAEAVSLFDGFLVSLAKLGHPVFITGGNHDSAERLAFGNRLIAASGIHLAPAYDGHILPYPLSDAYGPVDVFMLPFLRPAIVRDCFPDVEIVSYTDALSAAVRRLPLIPERRSVLVAHQFVTGAALAGSEDFAVGGIDNVDAAVFAPFSYVALGHLHRPQSLAGGRIRYCGSPLKYSFAEASEPKSVTVAELGEKGKLTIREIPLIPRHDLREIRGTYDELMRKSFYEHTTYASDYLRITLTDADDIPDAAVRLRTVYHNLMELSYDNERTRRSGDFSQPAASLKPPLELFADFYAAQNGQPLSDLQEARVRKLIEETWEEDQ